MGECLIMRRGGEVHRLPILNPNYPEDVTTTVIQGNTESATFIVHIKEPGNPAEYTYQWYVNGEAVSGATDSSYTKLDLSTTETYSIYCEVTNKAGVVTSRIATLNVTQYYTPILNSAYPANATVVFNESVTAKVEIATAGNPASYTYQWYKNGSAVSGATSATYTFTPGTVGTTTLYCKVTNAAGTVTSGTATITATYVYLYNNGDMCTDFTGGWESRSVGIDMVAPSFGTDGIRISISRQSSTNHKSSVAATKKAIDLTNLKTLKITVSEYSGTANTVRLGVYPGGNTNGSTLTSYAIINAVGNYSLNVENLTGKYYVIFGGNSKWPGGSTINVSAKMAECKAE